MKKLLILLLILFALSLFSCGEDEPPANSILLDNIYFVDGVDFEGAWSGLSWMFLRFHPDNIVERVDLKTITVGLNGRLDIEKHYGIFELDGRALTVTFPGEEPIIGVVHDEGMRITMAIGNGTFTHFNERQQERLASTPLILEQFN